MTTSTGGRSAELAYYVAQGIMTDPGEYAYLYENLSFEITRLVEAVQGTLIHIFHAHRYGEKLSEDRKKQVHLRKVADMLRRISQLDDRYIQVTREPAKRLVGNCRHFAVLLCSLLRHKGIPARARCGFATYFRPGMHEDHWICEYWNTQQKRWVQVDPQLDTIQLRQMRVSLNPVDLPPGKFLSGGKTWQLCRSGKIDPQRCGIGDLKGLWFVRDNVVRDFMALNKFELLPWDCTVFMGEKDGKVSTEQIAQVNRVAEMTTAPDEKFVQIRSLFQTNPIFRMPPDWKP